jgi:putative ABC transport system permease protein
MVLPFLAALVATPLLAAAAGRLVQPVFRYLLGLGGRLAADNLVRSPGRTGIVIAALAATGALLVQTAGFLCSTEHAIRTWIDEKIAADLFVSSGSPTTSASQSLTMREGLRRDLLRLDGVEAVLPVRMHRVKYGDHPVFLLGIDCDAFEGSAEDRPLARALNRFPQLRRPGTALVSENFAALQPPWSRRTSPPCTRWRSARRSPSRCAGGACRWRWWARRSITPGTAAPSWWTGPGSAGPTRTGRWTSSTST